MEYRLQAVLSEVWTLVTAQPPSGNGSFSLFSLLIKSQNCTMRAVISGFDHWQPHSLLEFYLKIACNEDSHATNNI